MAGPNGAGEIMQLVINVIDYKILLWWYLAGFRKWWDIICLLNYVNGDRELII